MEVTPSPLTPHSKRIDINATKILILSAVMVQWLRCLTADAKEALEIPAAADFTGASVVIKTHGKQTADKNGMRNLGCRATLNTG